MAVPVLLDLNAAWQAVPKDWALLGHCIYCATLAPELKGQFLLHFWITFMGGFGGGLTSALLIQNPQAAPISLFSSNTLGIFWVASWWALNYFPYGLPAKIHSFKPFKMVTKACVVYCKTVLIMARVDLATDMFPGIYLAPILLGTLAGCGGKFSVDTMHIMIGPEYRTNTHEGWAQSWSWRSAFLSAVFYFFAAKHAATKFLLAPEANALLLTLFVAHSLLSDLVDSPLDFSQPLIALMLRLANIPVPDAPAALAPKTKASAKASKPSPATNGSSSANGNGSADPTDRSLKESPAAPAITKPTGGSASLLSQTKKPTDYWNARINGVSKDKEKKKGGTAESKKGK